MQISRYSAPEFDPYGEARQTEPDDGWRGARRRRPARVRRGAPRLEVAHQSRARARRTRRRPVDAARPAVVARQRADGRGRCARSAPRFERMPAHRRVRRRPARHPRRRAARLDHHRLRTRRHRHALPAAGRRARPRPDDVRRRRGRPPPADGRLDRRRCAPSASTSTTTVAAPCRSPCTAPDGSRAASSRSTRRHRASSSRACCSSAPASSRDSTCATSASGCRACRTSR